VAIAPLTVERKFCWLVSSLQDYHFLPSLRDIVKRFKRKPLQTRIEHNGASRANPIAE
jgi:hypothetical protein